jgi:hypothetical protein
MQSRVDQSRKRPAIPPVVSIKPQATPISMGGRRWTMDCITRKAKQAMGQWAISSFFWLFAVI